MRKDDFVSYIIPSESEWKDVRTGETGLSSRAREPILIRTHLDFWPHFFSLVHQLHHWAHKTTIHFFSRQLYFHRVIHGSTYLHAYFFFLSPGTFDSKFELNSQVHNYDTRSSKLFHIPKIRTNICKFSLRYQGPRFYNSLSSDIQSARKMTSFINGLKTSLIDFWLFFPHLCLCLWLFLYNVWH